MRELEKLELKKKLYIKGEYSLIVDSLNEEVICAEFQSVDNGLFYRLQGEIQQQISKSDELLEKFQNGNKINLGIGGFC